MVNYSLTTALTFKETIYRTPGVYIYVQYFQGSMQLTHIAYNSNFFCGTAEQARGI